ncbi:hypothetical protein B0H13DRAFT_2304364 [Mycena leptocephala]|nr:hypothetical protein B0H13DRAFT_2304364 [Mycena leptocephala]
MFLKGTAAGYTLSSFLRSTRLHIALLDLSTLSMPPDPSTVCNLLLDPACPADVSYLTHIKLWRILPDSTDLGPFSIIRHVRRTMGTLEFDGSDPGVESLDFGSFPALTHPSSISTICYDFFASHEMTDLAALEACILAANMPVLEVSIWVRKPIRGSDIASFVKNVFRRSEPPAVPHPMYSQAEWTALIEEKMPGIVGRGILKITLR